MAVKDIFCTEGIPTTAGSRILEGYRPPYTATAVRRLREAGARVLGKTNMDEFAMGSSNENSGYGPVLNPWDPGRVPGGSSGGSAAAVAGAARALRDRHRHRRLDPPAGRALRDRRHEAHLRRGLALRDDRLRLLARPVRPADPERDRRRAAAPGVEGRDPAIRPRSASRAASRCPAARTSRASASGSRGSSPSEAEGIESGVREVFERTVALIEELGGEVSETELPHAPHGISAYYVLAPAEASANLARFDGVRYGLRVDGRGPDRDVRGDPRPGLRRRGEAPDHARHLRALLRLLRGLLRPRAAGPDQDRRGLLQGLRALRLRRHPDLADGRLQARRTHRRSRWRCTCPTTAPCRCRWPGSRRSRSPPGVAQPDGGGPELPVGFQIAGPAFSDSAMLDAAHALEQAIGFRRNGNGAAG